MAIDVTAVPFNRLLGLQRSAEPGFVFQLEEAPIFQNHIGTVHAGVQFALAEATSGEALLERFPDLSEDVFAVMRRVEAKYKNPITGTIRARASIQPAEAEQFVQTLAARGRAMISVAVEVLGQEGTVGLSGTFEWFARKDP